MSSQHLVQDPEKGANPGMMGDGVSSPRKEGPWKCLSLASFALLLAATALFALLQMGAFGAAPGEQDSKENGKSFAEDLLPKTMKVQALISRKPAAHAIASLAHHDKLVWTTNVAPSMLENGMRLDKEDNALVVPSTGLYFVYSQLLFHKDSCPSTVPVLLTHSISTWSEQFKTEVELLKSIKTACEAGHGAPGQKRLWFESIYQGAVFQLYKGDRLWSKTESFEFLNLERQGQIYFGVIAM
ncbi:tumor necrosis factor-like [Sceloporus undulatus]|uniref:tumor necrosis factor-like n=1 Tax=Sceloporus undulatus TaxID=8520 RepID=UPI001C4B433E|nr:tumor necrosis factor-like [Sceloporus undulatus]